MLKYLLFVVSVLCVGGAYAQQNIIESLQTRRAGEGVVTIHQGCTDYLFDRETLCAFYQFGAGKDIKSSWISRTGIRRE